MNFPFALNTSDVLPLFRNILETVINNDLVLTGRITPQETVEVRKMLSFIGKSPAEDINYSSISRNTGITKYKAEKFTDALEKTFILRRIQARGTSVSREPKILLSVPYRLLFKSFDDCLGGIREDFFVDMMRNQEREIFYLKSERGEKMPDYLCEDLVIEVGGRNKTARQFKGIACSRKIILTHPGSLDELRRPLFFAGMF